MRKHHTMSCPYPEGCSCGAAEYNNLLDQLYRQEQELATLRAKAKAYDEGETQSAIYNGKGVFLWCENGSYGKAEIPATYSERKVRVCKEVENEKGKE